MRVADRDLLREFREPGRCELCLKWCKKREPHHLWAKGMGGGGRLDVRINLIALGSTLEWQCECHTRIHNGLVPKIVLMVIVATREAILVDDLEAEMYRLRRE